MKRTFDKRIKLIFVLGVISFLAISCKQSSSIQVQEMRMGLEDNEKYFSEELLSGEIDDTRIDHVAFSGPVVRTVELSKNNVDVFVFIKGNGILSVDTVVYGLVPDSVAIPMACGEISIEVLEGEELHYVHFSRQLSGQDKEELALYPKENVHDVYFAKFSDCEPYTEKIKSPNTVSRTVLPADIVPRMALGTVEALGPDKVGAHTHAMLDQLFLGLAGNEISVYADDKSVVLKEYSLLHIPLGSSHWVTVDDNKKMYYLWMDFFISKEGQEWLKTHKPISSE